jgi:hypothetical protein
MKKILMFALAITIVSATPAIAGNLTCKYPKECVQPLGSKYSTGGGNKAIQYVQLDCRDSKGYMISFIDEMGSLSGLLGFGRLTMPNKISFTPSNKSKMECK